MKKFSLLLVLVLIVTACFIPTAFASSDQYAKVIGDNALFFSDEQNPLFVVTKDCYVKYIGDYNSTRVEVEYFGVRGYVQKADLDLANLKTGDDTYYGTPDSNATTTTITALFSSPNGNRLSDIPSGTIVKPIGKYNNGTIEYVYVIYQSNGTQRGVTYSLNVTWNGTVTPPITDTPTTSPGGENTGNNGANTGNNGSNLTVQDPENNLVRILLIIGICIPALIIVYLIFKPVRPSSNRYASDNPRRRDDYEDFE